MPMQPSSFASNVLKLVTGSMFAQGIGVLAAPIIARLFAPEAFGIAALFASITGIINVVVCLRYELAIMLPGSDEEAANLLGVSLCFVLMITGASALVVFFMEALCAIPLDAKELGRYIWLIPPAVLINGAFVALNYWCSRTKRFASLSVAKVGSAVVAQGTKLGCGFAGFTSGGALIGAGILGQIVSTSILGARIWRTDRHVFKSGVRWAGMISGLKRYKNFPVYGSWSALLNTASHQLPAFTLVYFFSPEIVGFYALGQMVISAPMNLVGGSIAKVFYQKASEAHNQTGSLADVVESVFRRLVSLGIFPILLLTLIGKDFFVAAFGARWAEAGVYMQILGPQMFFQFISSPVSTLFSVLEKQHYGLLFNGVLFGARAASLIVGGVTGDVRFTLFLFAGAGVACYSFLCFWLISKAGVPFKRALYCIVKYTLYSGPLLIVIALARFSLGVRDPGVLLLVLFCSLVYCFLIARQDRALGEPVRMLFRRMGCIK